MDRYITIFQETLPYNRVIVEIHRYDNLDGTSARSRYEPTRASQQRVAELVSNARGVTVEIEDSISVTARIAKHKLSKLDAWIQRESR